MEDTLNKILEDLNLWQLKELVLALRPAQESGAVSGKSRTALLGVLDAVSDKSKLILAAHKVETIAPHKHVLPLFLSRSWDYKELKTDLARAYPAIINRIDPAFELPLYSLAPELCIFDDHNERIYLKFNHQVEAVKWESITKDEKIRRRFRRRHPVVVCFRSSLQILTIEFMGYTQISIEDEPLRYNNIAAEICENLLSEASLETRPCDLRPSIQALLKDPLSGVSDCKLSLSDFEGKMTFSSDNEEQSLAEYLSKYLANVNISITVAQAREALDWGDTGDVALLWKKLQILTRVSLQEKIPEILFVWRGVEQSSSMIDDVLRMLTSKPPSLEQMSIDKIRGFLLNLGANSIVRPAALAKKFGASPEEALKLLLEVKSLGFFDFCFSAADWRRFGRAPGFTNRKPQHRNAQDLYPFARLVSHTGQPFAAAKPFPLQLDAIQRKDEQQRTAARLSFASRPVRTPGWVTLSRFRTSSRYAGRPAAADMAFSIAACAQGWAESEIAAALARDYLSRDTSRTRQAGYIRRTLDKAQEWAA